MSSNRDDINVFQMFGRAKNYGKKFPKYILTSFSVFVNCYHLSVLRINVKTISLSDTEIVPGMPSFG